MTAVRFGWRRAIPAGVVVALLSGGVLLAGLMQGVLVTGQVDPRYWLAPVLVAGALLLPALRLLIGGWQMLPLLTGVLALVFPPLLLLLQTGSTGPLPPSRWPRAADRPVLGVMSGPVLFAPVPGRPAFAATPLWTVLTHAFRPRPVDALDARALSGLRLLLLVQPRPLAPEELVMLDTWVSMGGRVVILADPLLFWADERPLGHVLRAPRRSAMEPLLGHWGLALGDASPVPAGDDPVKRRLLPDGRMLQLAGAGMFSLRGTGVAPTGRCVLAMGGLVAQCTVGKGKAIVVADADFANDALWTTDPERPDALLRWTSDAPACIADWIMPGAGGMTGRRHWVQDAAALPHVLRWPLLLVGVMSAMTHWMVVRARTKVEYG